MDAAVGTLGRAVVRKQGLRLVIDDVDPDFGQNNLRLCDDAVRQVVVE